MGIRFVPAPGQCPGSRESQSLRHSRTPPWQTTLAGHSRVQREWWWSVTGTTLDHL